MDTGLFNELSQLLNPLTMKNTIKKLPGEQMNALAHFFSEWGRGIKSRNKTTAEEIATGLAIAFCLGHEWVGHHWLLWPIDTSSQNQGKEMKANAPGPVVPPGKVVNVNVNLGPRMVMVDDKKLGDADSFTIEVREATVEELEKLKSANEIRLVKIQPAAMREV